MIDDSKQNAIKVSIVSSQGETSYDYLQVRSFIVCIQELKNLIYLGIDSKRQKQC